jgi:hypothetical protein
VVNIVAFQAIVPGSIPGRCTYFVSNDFKVNMLDAIIAIFDLQINQPLVQGLCLIVVNLILVRYIKAHRHSQFKH